MQKLEFKLINSNNIEELIKIKKIYNASFPNIERIDFEKIQTSIEYKKQFYLEAIIFNNQTIGFISYLLENKFIILCYFAIEVSYRGSGKGKKVLQYLRNKYPNYLIIGEIEHPINEIAKRRIEFYKRNNFFVSDFGYKQPALIPNTEPVPLLIISSPYSLTLSEYEQVKEILYKKVYCV